MFPLESTAIMCRPKNRPPFCPKLPSLPTTVPSERLRNQMVLLDRSEMYRNRCSSLSGENPPPPAAPSLPVLSRECEAVVSDSVGRSGSVDART